jgi:N-acylneuraminate cytidylyltransferase
MLSTYAIIPARSGSKGVQDKNIHLLGGHPLLAWSIAAAKNSRFVSRVFVSTDSEKYASIAIAYGAEAPFLRPPSLSGDQSPDRAFFVHALKWLQEHGQPVPDIWAHFRPTTPLRDPELIDDAIDRFIKTPEATSMRSAHEAPESPAKWFRLNEEGNFSGFMGDEWLNRPRQECPKGYIPNGYVDLLRSEIILASEEMYFPRMLAYLSPVTREVDTREDMAYLDYEARDGHALLTYLNSCFSGDRR